MIDAIIILGYFFVMLSVGWTSRRQTADSYWVAERRYDTRRVTASLVATIFGASSTMGIIGLGYSRGLTGSWWSLIGGLTLIPFALLLAPRVRALSVYTLPDILEKAYGKKVAMPAGCTIALAWCGMIAAQLVAGGRLLSSLVDVDFQTALAIVAIVFIVYTFWGGASLGYQNRLLAVDPLHVGASPNIGLPPVLPQFGGWFLGARPGWTPFFSGVASFRLV